jgi:hypothetical protein
MKKALIIVGAVAGVALLARRAARMCGGCNFEQMIERMPDDAPPKWMFRNIGAIRENTDRILEKLENEVPAAGDRTRTAA